MIWALFIDDLREPPRDQEWVVCRSTEEAIDQVRLRGMPSVMSLDHDLGDDDTTMVFLRCLVNELWDGGTPPPDYRVHSANPVGAQNIISFMESWRRSVSLNSNSDETTIEATSV